MNKLTEIQLTILKLIKFQNHNELIKIKEAYGKEEYDCIIEELVNLQLLRKVTHKIGFAEKVTYEFDNAKFTANYPTKKFNWIERFTKCFPVKVTRSDGKEDYLRVNKAKCQDLLFSLFLTEDEFDLFIEATKLYIKDQLKNNGGMYIKQTVNYLKDESKIWEKYYPLLENEEEKEEIKIPVKKDLPSYLKI